jgi:site-specific DNA-cytosine methylase
VYTWPLIGRSRREDRAELRSNTLKEPAVAVSMGATSQNSHDVQNNIQRLPIDYFDRYRAALWMLAPPCQPYTRQGLRRDASDARASSFLDLVERCSTFN